MVWLAVVVVALILASPVLADVSYTVTVTDDEAAVFAQAAAEANAFRRARPGRGPRPPDKTVSEYVTDLLKADAARLEDHQTERAAIKGADQRTPRERALVCKRLGLKSCPE